MQTNMLRNAAIAALLTTASAVSTLAADYTPFVRIEATLTDSGYDQFSTAPNGFEPGSAFTAGVFLGPAHEVSVSTGYNKWEGPEFGPVGVARISDEIEQIPVLLNYRYHFSLAEKLTLYVGPTLGLVHETATARVLQNVGPVVGLKPVGTYDDRAWKTAFGGSIGVSYAIADGWEINAAAHVLRLSGEDYDLAGSNGTSPYDSATRVGFSLGVGYRW